MTKPRGNTVANRKAQAKSQVDTAASGVTTPAEVWDETSLALHEKTLYPTIRVRTARAQGSGTIIYSQPRTEPDDDGEMGQEPFPTAGMLTGKNIEIDYRPYWMGSAPAIYGNSGGAVFLGRTLEMIGIVSRVGVTGGMFGGSPVTHLQYFCPPTEIHKFIHDEGYHFLVDPTHTEAQDLQALAEKDEDEEDDDE